MSHHRWGDESRQLFTEVYSRTCAVKNHARVRNEVSNDSLTSKRSVRLMSVDAFNNQWKATDRAYAGDLGGSWLLVPFDPLVPSYESPVC